MKTFSSSAQSDIARKTSGNVFVEIIDVLVGKDIQPSSVVPPAVIDRNGECHIRVTNADSDIIVDGIKYIAIPYRRDDVEEKNGSDNSITTTISIGDTMGIVYSFCKSMNYLSGCKCKLSFVFCEHGNNSIEYSYDFNIKKISTDRKSVSFYVATHAPWNMQFPPRRMYKAKCQFVFKGELCGYSGSDVSCLHTIADCRAKGNISRIGCFPGCGIGGLAK